MTTGPNMVFTSSPAAASPGTRYWYGALRSVVTCWNRPISKPPGEYRQPNTRDGGSIDQASPSAKHKGIFWTNGNELGESTLGQRKTWNSQERRGTWVSVDPLRAELGELSLGWNHRVIGMEQGILQPSEAFTPGDSRFGVFANLQRIAHIFGFIADTDLATATKDVAEVGAPPSSLTR